MKKNIQIEIHFTWTLSMFKGKCCKVFEVKIN